MPDEALRQFYDLAGKPLQSINEWRLATAKIRGVWDFTDAQASIEAAIGKLRAVFEADWATQISAVEEYSAKDEEWRIACGVWRHGGQDGPEPNPPEWPSALPQIEDAMLIVRDFIVLRNQACSIERMFTDSAWLTSMIERLIHWLDNLKQLIEAPEDDQSDGPIDRNKLAAMLGIQPKTLANRAGELPNPIARDARQTPIYMYRAARLDLIKMYPEKTFMLPERFGEIGQSN